MAQDPNRLDARVSVLESVTVQHTNTLGDHAHALKETAETLQKTKDRLDFHVNFVKGAMWVLVPIGTILAFILSQAKELIAHTISK